MWGVHLRFWAAEAKFVARTTILQEKLSPKDKKTTLEDKIMCNNSALAGAKQQTCIH